MAILCQSESSNLHFRSNLSLSGGRITGSWEERTYNAQGNASGQVSGGKISLNVRRCDGDDVGYLHPLATERFDLNAGDSPGKREDRTDSKLVEDGYPKLPACLDRRPLTFAEAA